MADALTMDAPRRTRERRGTSDAVAVERFAAENVRKINDLDAPKACIAAIKASVDLPFDEGQALERELFAELVAGAQSTALRHAFFAERAARSEEHTSELQSLMRISYAVFCLKKKKIYTT